MAKKHLLRCECGIDLLVEPRQAGQHVECTCGQSVAVPGLSAIRALPEADEQAPESRGGWSVSHGVLTAGLLLATALAGGGAYVWSTEPPAPEAYTPEARTDRLANVLQSLEPYQLFDLWGPNYRYLARTGIPEYSDRQSEYLQHQVDKSRQLRWALLGAAALVALGAIGSAAVMRRGPAPG